MLLSMGSSSYLGKRKEENTLTKKITVYTVIIIQNYSFQHKPSHKADFVL